jgi:hypothetical protein
MHSGTGANGFGLLEHPLATTIKRPRHTANFMMTSKQKRGRSIAIRLAIVNLWWLSGWLSVAEAHPEFNPARVNRYLKLTLVGANQVRLAYTAMYGAGPALAARSAVDANRDRIVDGSEARELGARLLAGVEKGLSISVDGKPAVLRWETPAVGLLGSEVSPIPFSIDLVARIDCPGAPPHELALDDRTELAEPGETEVRAEESPSTTLLALYRGRGGEGRPERILWSGPRSLIEDRTVTVRFTAANANAAPKGRADAAAGGLEPRKLAVVVGLGVAMAAAVLLVLRRYRNMNG